MLALSGENLYHDGVSVIDSRLTFFTENFVICCYQVTKVFCSRHCITGVFPARNPCNLGSQADFTIPVLREVSINTVLTRYRLYLEIPDLIHEKCLRVYPLMLTLLRPLDCL